MLDFKRRRGTAIVDTLRGILVVSHDNRTFYLPGGGAEKGESQKTLQLES
jgi:8-oxo-dGTP pyrophosphatase MutT (NUDIX family)